MVSGCSGLSHTSWRRDGTVLGPEAMAMKQNFFLFVPNDFLASPTIIALVYASPSVHSSEWQF